MNTIFLFYFIYNFNNTKLSFSTYYFLKLVLQKKKIKTEDVIVSSKPTHDSISLKIGDLAIGLFVYWVVRSRFNSEALKLGSGFDKHWKIYNHLCSETLKLQRQFLKSSGITFAFHLLTSSSFPGIFSSLCFFEVNTALSLRRSVSCCLFSRSDHQLSVPPVLLLQWVKYSSVSSGSSRWRLAI
ncbi:BnaA01g26890D [Brassica napus]|uniref:BnaA01g26890D protein n=2 Tax=Brassica napus TaxID=3708 RepID=A0A078FZP7_BRANA|nr:BnaA01g26890D [Brassica napus]